MGPSTNHVDKWGGEVLNFLKSQRAEMIAARGQKAK